MPAADTYQEDRMGLRSGDAWRLPVYLTVSDLGIQGIPIAARERFPEGARFIQLVDCHLGFQAGEAELVAAGFGAARSWHYEALGIPQNFRDGEGHPVQRWMRIFVGGGACRVVGPDGRPTLKKLPLEVWRG